MNRIQFMTQLAALLQDLPVEERREAMKYYNDYFDDAGAENEQKVIAELESPEKVAENLKADLNGTTADNSEFTETGYSRMESDKREVPDEKGYAYQGQPQEKTSNRTLKIILICAIILIAAPIVLPLFLGLLATAFAVLVSVAAAAVSLVICGIVLIVKGIILLIPHLAVGLCLLGTGLILTAVGAIGIVATLKFCIFIFPKLYHGIVAICRKLFERKAVI